MIPQNQFETLDVFQEHAQERIRQLASSGLPLVLTVDGEPAVVVQDANAYRQLMEAVERAEVVLAVRQGLEGLADGEGLEFNEADAILRKRLGFPPKS